MNDNTFDFYYEYYASKIDKMPQRDDFMKVLEWSADKPGHVFGYRDLVHVIDENAAPEDPQAFGRAISVAVILTGWKHPIASTCFEVKSADGNLYPVDTVPQAALDGKAPYVLEATGETIEDFAKNAYPRFRLNDFEPRPVAAQVPAAKP